MATGIREGLWWFPIIETIHTLGIVLVAGTILILDLRLLGVIFRKESVSDVAQQVLPLTWAGFSVMFISGLFLFLSRSSEVLPQHLFPDQAGPAAAGRSECAGVPFYDLSRCEDVGSESVAARTCQARGTVVDYVLDCDYCGRPGGRI